MRDNFIYISTDPVRNMVVARGIDSADFVKGLKVIPNNIVLLNDDRKHANGLNAHTKFSTIQGSRAVKAYLLDNKINDKRIIDFRSDEGLDNLLDYEIADLLYLSHMGFPMHIAFSSKLQNRYIYMMMRAHFTRVFYRYLTDFDSVLDVCLQRHLLATIEDAYPVLSRGASVWGRISHHRSGSVRDVPSKILKKLVRITENGMIVAFDRTKNVKHRRFYEIPLLVEQYPDTQSTWYYKQDIYQNTDQVGELTYGTGKRGWCLNLKKS